MEREKYNSYHFEIIADDDVWLYAIFYPEYPQIPPLRISDECFDTEQEARFAAIGHISLLENGEG